MQGCPVIPVDLCGTHVPNLHLYQPLRSKQRTMTKKEHTTKLVDEKPGLMECLVCGEK